MKKRRSEPAAEPEMQKYTCAGCGFQGFDIQEYFSGRPSTRCIWCAKYGIPKKPVAKPTDSVASDTAEKA
jgi:hypothetical protein